jgi:hypothetical protein
MVVRACVRADVRDVCVCVCIDRAATKRDIMEAREFQRADKERRLAEQAREERHIFERIVRQQREAEEAETAKETELKSIRIKARDEILAQSEAKFQAKYGTRFDKFDEGNAIKAQNMEEFRKLEEIKQRKLQELDRAGVPDKYKYDLMHKKIVGV